MADEEKQEAKPGEDTNSESITPTDASGNEIVIEPSPETLAERAEAEAEDQPSASTESKPEPESESEEVEDDDEPSAAEAWRAERMAEIKELPEDEQAAAVQNFISGLPDDLKRTIPELKAAKDQVTSSHEAAERDTQTQADVKESQELGDVSRAARERAFSLIETPVKALWDKPAEEFPSEYKPEMFDVKGINSAIQLAALAEGTLMSRGIRAKIAEDLVGALQEYGDLTEDDLTAFSEEAKDTGKSTTQVYLSQYKARVTDAAKAEARDEMKAENDQWRKAETAAIRTQLAKEMNVEPERKRGAPSKGEGELPTTLTDMTDEEIGDMTAEDHDKMTQRWLAESRA